MADSKKYDGSQWEHSLRKLTTATEAVENPLYSDGTAITAYTLKGNTVQNGTPTPSNPVEVNGVGVRTINLYDGTTSATNARLSTSGTGTYAVQGWSVSSFMPINPSTNYCTNLSTQSYYCLYDENKSFLVGGIISNSNPSPRTYANAKFIRFDFPTDNLPEVQLSEGRTGQDYEPYGYKIPISSGGVTTNIYLGSTQTVRLIKKVVFDGTENWEGTDDTISKYLRFYIYDYKLESGVTCMSTHYSGTNNIVSGDKIPNNSVCFYNAKDTRILYLKGSELITLADFKAYLAQQYAAGTPVTVWYVLAEPETAAVNEPLMKIGDYSDTLSNAPSIPTTEGANSITVDTTVQPSEFTATWTGWHDAESVHEKSKNLFDKDRTNGIVDNSYINISGGTSTDSSYYISYPIYLTVGETYTWRFDNVLVHSAPTIGFYDNSNNLMGVAPHDTIVTNFSFTVPSGCAYVKCSVYKILRSEAMLNSGSTALPYEPYWE